jgi:asparagine synthetase B (glutamine-hydrolysing)
MKMNHFIRTRGLIDPPQGIIPPPIVSYKQYPYLTYDPIPYDLKTDYWGNALSQIGISVSNALKMWNDDFEKIDRVGVWLDGFDSALVLKYAVDILGKDKVIAYNISFDENVKPTFAQATCDFLNVPLRVELITPQDVFPDIIHATYMFRAPSWCPYIYTFAKRCKEDGTKKCLTGLGLSALGGGYAKPYRDQTDVTFTRLEEANMANELRDIHWAFLYQSREFVELMFPFLENKMFIQYLKSLPVHHKSEGTYTKVRIRREALDLKILPEAVLKDGLKDGTKRWFEPDLKKWFDDGYNEWALQHDPALKGFDTSAFGNWKESNDYHIKMILSSIHCFYELIEKEAFGIDV